MGLKIINICLKSKNVERIVNEGRWTRRTTNDVQLPQTIQYVHVQRRAIQGRKVRIPHRCLLNEGLAERHDFLMRGGSSVLHQRLWREINPPCHRRLYRY